MRRIVLIDVNAMPSAGIAVWIDDSEQSERECMAAIRARGSVRGEVCRRVIADHPVVTGAARPFGW